MLCQFLVYNKMNQIYFFIHSPPFWVSFPLRSPQSIKQSSLCSTVGHLWITLADKNLSLLILVQKQIFFFKLSSNIFYVSIIKPSCHDICSQFSKTRADEQVVKWEFVLQMLCSATRWGQTVLHILEVEGSRSRRRCLS